MRLTVLDRLVVVAYTVTISCVVSGTARLSPLRWKCEEQADYQGGQGGHLPGRRIEMTNNLVLQFIISRT